MLIVGTPASCRTSPTSTGSDQNGPITAATYAGSSATSWARSIAFAPSPSTSSPTTSGTTERSPASTASWNASSTPRSAGRTAAPSRVRHVVEERDLHSRIGIGVNGRDRTLPCGTPPAMVAMKATRAAAVEDRRLMWGSV